MPIRFPLKVLRKRKKMFDMHMEIDIRQGDDRDYKKDFDAVHRCNRSQ